MKSLKKLGTKSGQQKDNGTNKVSGQPGPKSVQRKKVSDKEITCKIRLLDDAQIPLEVTIRKSDLGKRVFIYVCDAIGDLVECDYFGLRYTDKHEQRQWLDLERCVYKQLKGCKSFNLSFRVKHYPADPISDLKQDLTRYLLYLQIRRDLAQGRLLCPPHMVGRIGALVAQAELGDAPESQNIEDTSQSIGSPASQSTTPVNGTNYSPNATTDSPEPKSIPPAQISVESNLVGKLSTQEPEKVLLQGNYLRNLKIMITQTPKVEDEIMKEHKILRGLTTQEAETELLSRASQLVTYGIDPFPVRPLHKVVIPRSNLSGQSTNEAGDQSRTEANASAATTASTDAPTYLPKGTAFYMGITGSGLVTFVGLQRSQEYRWDRIQRVGCDGERFLVYLKKDEHKPGKQLFRNKSSVLTFQCESKSAALALWRWTVDRKCFFTLKQASEAKRLRPTSNIFQRSHTYRFSGRSQQELTSIPIRNTKNDFIRVSSLRRVIGSYTSGDSGASFGRATLPSRLRPPLELHEETRPCEVIEAPNEQTFPSEFIRPVIVPDTVIEQPVEEEESAEIASELKVEESKLSESEPQSVVTECAVEEPEIQATQMPHQLAVEEPLKPESKQVLEKPIQEVTDDKCENQEMEVRRRTENVQSLNGNYLPVLWNLDKTIERHTGTNGKGWMEQEDGVSKSVSSNGEVIKSTGCTTHQNGPIMSKVSQMSSLFESQPATPSESKEVVHGICEKDSVLNPTAVKITVTAMTVVFLVGLIVFLETRPTADATIHRFMRSNALVNTFDNYIYSPIRNAIVSGLTALWS